VNKILIIQTAFIGDVILATPVAEKLHRFFPDAGIDFLVRKGTEELFTGHPFIHDVLIWNRKRHKYKNLFKIIRIVRSNHYDLIVNLHRFGSSGIVTAFSKAKRTIGFNKNPFSIFFGKRVKHIIGKGNSQNHEIDRNLLLIVEYGNQNHVMPRLYPTVKDFKKVEIFSHKEYICIAPASVWFTKQYPKEKWIEFVRSIEKTLHICLIGSETDKVLCDEIIGESRHQSIENMAGELTLLETAALMKNAKMNFVNDSAPMHIASAMNAPVSAVYCSTIPDFGFGPLSEKSTIIQTDEPLECRPCGLHGLKSCPENYFECAYTIRTENLLKTL
jgi:heptosyltransferase-2